MQVPAAPKHEIQVQEDRRDWALEQMARAAAAPTAADENVSTKRRTFEDISAGAAYCLVLFSLYIPAWQHNDGDVGACCSRPQW